MLFRQWRAFPPTRLFWHIQSGFPLACLRPPNQHRPREPLPERDNFSHSDNPLELISCFFPRIRGVGTPDGVPKMVHETLYLTSRRKVVQFLLFAYSILFKKDFRLPIDSKRLIPIGKIRSYSILIGSI